MPAAVKPAAEGSFNAANGDKILLRGQSDIGSQFKVCRRIVHYIFKLSRRAYQVRMGGCAYAAFKIGGVLFFEDGRVRHRSAVHKHVGALGRGHAVAPFFKQIPFVRHGDDGAARLPGLAPLYGVAGYGAAFGRIVIYSVIVPIYKLRRNFYILFYAAIGARRLGNAVRPADKFVAVVRNGGDGGTVLPVPNILRRFPLYISALVGKIIQRMRTRAGGKRARRTGNGDDKKQNRKIFTLHTLPPLTFIQIYCIIIIPLMSLKRNIRL